MIYQAVIFDLDGTLYDSRFLAERVLRARFFETRLLAADRIVRRELAGQYYPEGAFPVIVKMVASKTRLTEERVANWYESSFLPAQVHEIKVHYKPRPWVVDLIRNLRNKGVKLALMSDYGFAEQKLNALGLNPEWFDLICESSEMGGLKPCRQSFLRVCELLGSEPSQTLVLGDRDDTDGGAVSAGLLYANVKTSLGEQTISALKALK